MKMQPTGSISEVKLPQKFEGRLAVSIPEFCEIMGWHRSRYYRHRKKIIHLKGYGRPMIATESIKQIIASARFKANAEGTEAKPSVR